MNLTEIQLIKITNIHKCHLKDLMAIYCSKQRNNAGSIESFLAFIKVRIMRISMELNGYLKT